MLPAEVLQDYETLPTEAQRQVIDFIEFMKARYQKTKSENKTSSIEDSFGLLKASRTVTLDEMDMAVETEGGKL
ncbi:DUF2281 domain-containing protein [Leucothrix pacifica]|uniref:DUF2281 domain-containing protein n=1 Tax=Leucothrix pacifica TaxID=1247513 RepID=A0A317CWE7_9GAMM|nr:DUF2281 domain-containing protein [Leucothrix pacifica]PWR00603.1 hypothetical protein DKW60_00890 [Leucothrix pacifica]